MDIMMKQITNIVILVVKNIFRIIKNKLKKLILLLNIKKFIFDETFSVGLLGRYQEFKYLNN